MARLYLDQGKLDLWQAMVDDYLARLEDDETKASLRIDVANVFLDRGEYGKALPYAAAAVEKNSEPAMDCMVRCHLGLGDDEEEGLWHERISDRYPSARNAREQYFWSRRSGLGDAAALAEAALLRIGPEQEFAPLGEQLRYAAFFWLTHHFDDAVGCYQRVAGMAHDDPGKSAFANVCIALIGQEQGDAAARDAALETLAALRGADVDQFRRTATWLAAGLKAKHLDIAAAQQIAADAPAAYQPAINFVLGYALALAGQAQDAVPFLQTASTLRQAPEAMSRTLAAAALRDRGLVPGKLRQGDE